MLVDCAHYKDGCRQNEDPLRIEEAAERIGGDDGFVWLGLHDPEPEELLEVAESIALSHHERWDGTGYPDGLSVADIPLVGRLVHVADVFDILVHERPYKDAFSVEDAAAEIQSGAGTQFDPEIVEAFADLGPRVWLAAPGVYGG